MMVLHTVTFVDNKELPAKLSTQTFYLRPTHGLMRISSLFVVEGHALGCFNDR